MAKKTQAEVKAANKEYRRKALTNGKKLDMHGRALTKRHENDKPMREFWDTIDHEQMVEALSTSTDDKFQSLVNYMLNPGPNFSMTKACREAGITLQELNELWHSHNLALGLIKVNAHLPKVMGDTAEDAESRYEDALSDCAPDCPDDVVDPIDTSDVLANVFLGLSAASAAGAVALYFLEGQNREASAALSVDVGAANFQMQGRF